MEYTVTEFRRKFREILDAVDRGAEVRLIRYDRTYLLSAAASKDDNDAKKQANKNLGKIADGLAKAPKALIENAKKGKIEVPKDLCPHGYAKGMCKKADCNKKFAKK